MTTWSALIANRPAGPAVVEADGSAWSTDELLARAAGAAAWLDAVGAEPPLPLPALVASTAGSFALLVAGAATGRPLAPLNPRAPLDDLATCVARMGAPVLLLSPAHADVGAEVARRCGCRLAVIPDPIPAGNDLDLGQDLDDVVAVVHTSGTTGLPKAVAQTQGPLAGRAAQSAGPIDLGPGAIYASASAFHHQAGVGMVLVALASGAAIAVFPRFTTADWPTLGTVGVTHATIVPTFIEDLLAAGSLGLPDLRCIQYGSAPLHPDTARRLLREYPHIRLHQNLGQTEGSPITNLDHADHLRAVADRPSLLTSVGRAVPGSSLRIEHPDRIGVGEIVSRADHYFTPDPDGWLRTGDLGSLDDDGYVSLVGRKNDAINRGGETVYPVEVERVLVTHPKVANVAVAGVAERRLGQVVHAWIIPIDVDDPPTVDELDRYARQRLARHKVPTGWWIVAELPVNAAGKVLRRLLVPLA